ncbi:hypothetical protein APHAL10511_007828 [Amanita phalloides]|nr:hypothetical protein APHAL10511_007828 [Amanita phalloides]
MTINPDEETPLLRSEQNKKSPTPLPLFQFCIVLFLQLAEPLTSQVIYPFTPDLIRNIGITNGNEKKVGYYVGVMQSLFYLTQAVTVLHWSRVSDIIGRKPVILTGLFGLSLSMYCFGLSTTFWGLVFSRSLNGALNGNIGVIKSMMAEMTDETNISRAYAFMPIAWSTGGTLGPMIGGSLSRPAEQFPRLFGDNEFLKKYPYFLPCAIPATFSILAWLITFLFLKETVPYPVSISQLFKGLRKKQVDEDPFHGVSDKEKPLPLRSLLTRRVVVAAANYASLSLLDISFRAIQPVFFSTSIEDGGLGLSPATIGNILSVFGILNGIFQIFFFAKINDKFGSKSIFILGVVSGLPLFALFPVINYLARIQSYSLALWFAIALQVVISILTSVAYGAIFIFIQGAAPNRASLGATNGLCQLSVSVMRAIGPATANSLFSLSIDKGYLGGQLVYYIMMGIVGIALYVATLLPRNAFLVQQLKRGQRAQLYTRSLQSLILYPCSFFLSGLAAPIMSSFQALMALSASQTKESQSAVQVALQDRQRKEAARRREQEDKERKEKEREKKVRMMHFEEQKKEQERLRREEEKRKAMELALQRREDEQRNALLFGPKKASKWPTSTSGAKEAVRRGRLPSGDNDDGGQVAIGSFFTREELRQRKQAAEQRRLMHASSRRSSGAGGYSKQGKRLPGGAVDSTAPSSATDSGNFKSVKDRLAAQPITLTKLNVIKRDTRTIDEIVQDRAKAKILDGDKAREFSDWFGTSKKKEVVKKTSSVATLSQSSSASSISSLTLPSASHSANSAVTSGANTPVSQRETPGPSDVPASTSGKKTPVQSAKLISVTSSSRPMFKPTASPSSGASKSHSSSVHQTQPSKTSLANGKSISKPTTVPSSSSQSSAKTHSQSAMLKKRPRSESRSESPPPKRRGHAPDDDGAGDDLKSMIWGMFGRNRAEYVSRDVFSDDEDMEADASLVEKEEAVSTRMAAKEDQLALEQERRREEEKRRRKKEREARAPLDF